MFYQPKTISVFRRFIHKLLIFMSLHCSESKPINGVGLTNPKMHHNFAQIYTFKASTGNEMLRNLL